MTMTVGDFTELSLLVPQLVGADQATAIHALSHRLQGAGRIEESLTFFQSALQRDYLSSSAIEGGVAFPHARGHGIHRFSLALGLSKEGIHWRDGSQVHAVFLIGVPSVDTQLYLAVGSALARQSRLCGWLTALMACNRPEELLDMLNKVNVSEAGSIRTGQSAGESRRDVLSTPSGENVRHDVRPKGQASGQVA
ncbi:MAG: PTS sugar transporter subunit IIA [Verrucomicrobiia bacterium]|jgi:mannitol/fructose-specific phosphotransferase system IIA component (Ntr-type)